MRLVDIMDNGVVERESRQVRSVRIRIYIGEVELESSESESQFVHLRRADYRAQRQRPILRRPLNLSARRKTGIYRRPVVQRVALQLLFFCPKHPKENAVVGIEVVVNT